MSYKFLPDLRFLPDGATSITAATTIADGVPLGTFLKGVTLDHIPDLADRQQIVRNLLPHAHIVKSTRESDKRFAKYKLVVVEGIYNKSPEEELTPDGQKDLAQTGRSIVYELRRNGKTDLTKTVELAQYIAMFYRVYDKITLDFDSYNEGELNAQIIINTPVISSSYDPTFDLLAETTFNNVIQARNQLVEITEIPSTKTVLPAVQPDSVTGYFTVGDIHARLLQSYGGTPWQSFARDGRTSRETAITDNIKKIKAGQVVVISVGYNDAVRSTDDPEVIAGRVLNIVRESIKRDHVVTFMLPPVTNEGTEKRQIAVRNAIVNKLATVSIRLQDLNDSQYQLDVDGKSLTRESYINVSNLLV